MQTHTCRPFWIFGAIFSCQCIRISDISVSRLKDLWCTCSLFPHAGFHPIFINRVYKIYSAFNINKNTVVNITLLRQIANYQASHLLNIFTTDNMTDCALTIKSWNPSNCHWVMCDIEDPQRCRGIWCRSYIQFDGSGGKSHLIPHHTLITPIVWWPHVFYQENWLILHNIQLKNYFEFFTIWHGLITVSLHYTYLFVI